MRVARSRFWALALSCGVLVPSAASALEEWRADLRVTMTATEDAAAGTVTHVVTVRNQGDDAAREVRITHIPVLGMTPAVPSGCWLFTVYAGVNAVQCRVPILNVGATAQITVVTDNTAATGVRRVTTAQAMGASPDANGADNVARLDLP
jgi:uncharacterized protein DUF11